MNAPNVREGLGAGTTDWFACDQLAVDVFATLVRDVDPAHNDPQWASAHTPSGHTIVQGAQILAMIPSFLRAVDSTHELGIGKASFDRLSRVRFASPLRVGERARARVSVVERLGGSTTVEVTVESEGAVKPMMVANLALRSGSAPDTSCEHEVPNRWRIIRQPPRLPRIGDGDLERYFAELHRRVGHPLGRTEWYVVDQLSADCFGRVVNDFQPEYNSPAMKTTASEARPVVHPFYLLAVTAALGKEVGLPYETSEDHILLNYGFDSTNWFNPPRVGDRLRGHLWLQSVIEKSGGVLFAVRHVTEVQHRADPCLITTNLGLLLRQARRANSVVLN